MSALDDPWVLIQSRVAGASESGYRVDTEDQDPSPQLRYRGRLHSLYPIPHNLRGLGGEIGDILRQGHPVRNPEGAVSLPVGFQCRAGRRWGASIRPPWGLGQSAGVGSSRHTRAEKPNPIFRQYPLGQRLRPNCLGRLRKAVPIAPEKPIGVGCMWASGCAFLPSRTCALAVKTRLGIPMDVWHDRRTRDVCPFLHSRIHGSHA